jgi:uncharacterized protein (DUF2249 family)
MMSVKPLLLDVSELAAPEPMRKILTSLAQLQQGRVLLVMHRKEPKPLYSKLIDMGFEFVVKNRGQANTPQYLIAIAYACDLALITKYIEETDDEFKRT